MSAIGPAAQLEKGVMVHTMERLVGVHLGVVVRPPADHEIEAVDQDALCGRPIFPYHVADCLQMPLSCVFAGCDDGDEPKRLPVDLLARILLANGMLTYVEAQEVKPNVAVMHPECVRDARLAWFQFQPHAF